MGWRETREEMGYDNLTSQTRKEEERGREWKTQREGGGYTGTPEPSDMTQMQCATVQRANGRVEGREEKRGMGEGAPDADFQLCCHPRLSETDYDHVFLMVLRVLFTVQHLR